MIIPCDTLTSIVAENPWSDTPIVQSPILEGIQTTESPSIESEPVGTVQFANGRITSPEFPRTSVLIAEITTGEPVLACSTSISISRPVACAGNTRITPTPDAPDELLTLTFHNPGAPPKNNPV